MGEPLVVSALKTKRAELAGDIELTARRLQELRATLRRCQRDKGTRGVRARGWGAMALMGNYVMIADGAYFGGLPPGNVAGVAAFSMLDFRTFTSTQAVLAPFDIEVLGPTYVSVNRDSGLETLIFSR